MTSKCFNCLRIYKSFDQNLTHYIDGLKVHWSFESQQWSKKYYTNVRKNHIELLHIYRRVVVNGIKMFVRTRTLFVCREFLCLLAVKYSPSLEKCLSCEWKRRKIENIEKYMFERANRCFVQINVLAEVCSTLFHICSLASIRIQVKTIL